MPGDMTPEEAAFHEERRARRIALREARKAARPSKVEREADNAACYTENRVNKAVHDPAHADEKEKEAWATADREKFAEKLREDRNVYYAAHREKVKSRTKIFRKQEKANE